MYIRNTNPFIDHRLGRGRTTKMCKADQTTAVVWFTRVLLSDQFCIFWLPCYAHTCDQKRFVFLIRKILQRVSFVSKFEFNSAEEVEAPWSWQFCITIGVCPINYASPLPSFILNCQISQLCLYLDTHWFIWSFVFC